jgi:putative SOS response-associated peptidase YedK
VESRNTLIAMRWGLIPSWWTKAVKDVPPTFNVHARRVTEPFFWSAFKRNRCIIPASGYFEWKTMPDGKQPHYISAADGAVLSIAGVSDTWNNIKADEIVSSCSMIITSANAFTRAVHNRMPAFLTSSPGLAERPERRCSSLLTKIISACGRIPSVASRGW